MNNLNAAEKVQYSELLSKIRRDLPFSPKPARDHVPLVRGRVCIALNYDIDHGIITDVKVDRSRSVDQYYHI